METPTKTAHTPGPWRFFENETALGYRVEKPVGEEMEYPVALVYNRNQDPQNEANARLIAAAPELLKVLEDIAEFWSDYPNHLTPIHPGGQLSDGDAPIVDVVRAAIKKARGL